MTWLTRSIPALSLVAVACGSPEPAASPATQASPPAAPSAEPAPPAASAEPAPEPKKRKPYTIVSTCSDVVTIAFGEDGKGGKRTIAPSSSIDGPRDADGNQTIWLLDTKDQQLVKVRVTRGMSRVEIGKSCRTIDAR